MNQKQLISILIVCIVLAGIGFVLYRKQNSSWSSSSPSVAGKVLPNFPINDVAQVRIQESNAVVNLTLTDGQWRVKERWDYPASFSEISEALKKFWSLKPVQPVIAGPSQYGRLQLLTPDKGATNSGALITFFDKNNKPLDSVVLGKKYMRESQDNSPFGGGGFPAGRYLLVVNRPSPVWLVSDALTEMEAKPERWLDKDFLKVSNPKLISITSTNTTNSWMIVRDSESGPWKLSEPKPGEELDSSKVSVMNSILSSPSFNDVTAPDLATAKTGLDHPRVGRIETFDQFSYQLQIGNKTEDDNYYVHVAVSADFPRERPAVKDEKPEDKQKKDKEFQENLKKLQDKLKKEKGYEKWTYLVAKWTIDPLLKDRKDLLAEKKKEEPAATSGSSTNGLPSFNPLVPVPTLNANSSTNQPKPPPVPPSPGAGSSVTTTTNATPASPVSTNGVPARPASTNVPPTGARPAAETNTAPQPAPPK